jgi:hypothetical protein
MFSLASVDDETADDTVRARNAMGRLRRIRKHKDLYPNVELDLVNVAGLNRADQKKLDTCRLILRHHTAFKEGDWRRDAILGGIFADIVPNLNTGRDDEWIYGDPLFKEMMRLVPESARGDADDTVGSRDDAMKRLRKIRNSGHLYPSVESDLFAVAGTGETNQRMLDACLMIVRHHRLLGEDGGNQILGSIFADIVPSLGSGKDGDWMYNDGLYRRLFQLVHPRA